jgi:hypothetical protein
MSKFTLVRGWLECSFDESNKMRVVTQKFLERSAQYDLSTEMVNNYMKGWKFPDAPINWVSIVFFGADVNQLALPFIKALIIEAAAVGNNIAGVFLC